MDVEGAKIRAETIYLRCRGWIRMLFAVVGLGLMLIGAANMLLGTQLFVWYRELFPMLTVAEGTVNRPIIYVADVAVMAVGAIMAWLS